MSTRYNDADGKPVVVKDGQRTGGVHETQQKAEAEVQRLKQVQETTGSAAKPAAVEVKTNLYG